MAGNQNWVDSAVDLGPSNPDLDPNRSKLWTIPPILSKDSAKEVDQGFVMTQGIVYEVQIGSENFLLQNVSENEDDYIEVSTHGDIDGIWMKLNTHSMIKANGTVFLLNRSHKQNCKVAVIKA